MKRWKLSSLALIMLCLLLATQAGCAAVSHLDNGTTKATQPVTEECSSIACPGIFKNIDQQNLRMDWIHRSDTAFSLKEIQDPFTVEYTYNSQHYTLDEYFKRSSTLGFLVLHDDQIIMEKYCSDAGPQSRFISNSMAKSVVSVLTGIAVHKGYIRSVDDNVTDYLPSLSESGFKKVTIKQLLQMASGIRWNEDYLAPGNDFNRYLQAWSQGKPSFMELAATCEPVEPPGTRFEYQSINTQVLGQLLEAATGMPLNEFCERELWKKIGSENDAFFYRGKQQPQTSAAVGFCATLRDYGRFGLVMMNNGISGSSKIIPQDWVSISTTIKGASEMPRPVNADYAYSESLGYAYQWWLLNNGVYLAMGIYGQAIYIDPARHIVIVQTSAWKEPDPDEGWDEMIKVMTTIADKIHTSESFTRQIWEENYPLYQKILTLPFNQELLSGELNEELFKNYIIQDYYFLQNYKIVYGILLAKAPDDNASQIIRTLIQGTDDEIKSIHEIYIEKYHINSEELKNATLYPSTEFYNSYLIKTATLEPFQVGLMATLPCPWIYFQLSSDMEHSTVVQNNKYQAWIDWYYEGGAWEDSDAKKVVDLAEKYMQTATDENKFKMKKAFETAMKLEYMFWDGVYNRVQWVK